MTEPLTAGQRDAIGWAGREGMSDAGNQFHYFRQSADDRILWGGYDAIYHPGNAVKPAYDARPATFDALARQFVETFPQLDGIRFTHRWGGAIDTSTRFSVTFGDALGGRVHYALGYTGLGVGATRWAAGILRDTILRPGLGPAPAPVRPLASVPDPAGARPDARGRGHAPVGDRRGLERGPAGAVPPGDGRARDRLRLVGRFAAAAAACGLQHREIAHSPRSCRRKRGLTDRGGARRRRCRGVEHAGRDPSAPALGDLMVSRTTARGARPGRAPIRPAGGPSAAAPS